MNPCSPIPPRLPMLDGLRGLAIVMVMLHHFVDPQRIGWGELFYRLSTLGWAGLDLFFVLSGFLITGILLDLRAAKGRLVNFYARRILRIFPLYYAVLFVAMLWFWMSPQQSEIHLGDSANHSVWWWLHLSNIYLSLRNAWAGGVLNHLWTLAIEEQFYLVWPLVVLFTPQRFLLVVPIIAPIIGIASRAYCYAHGYSPASYIFTTCRWEGLFAGAWLAIIPREPGGIQRFFPSILILGFVSAAGLGWLLYVHGLQLDLTNASPGLTATLFIAVTFMAVVAACVVHPSHLLIRWISYKPLQNVGLLSYGIYVLHPLVQYSLEPLISFYSLKRSMGYGLATLVKLGILLPASYLAAWLSWHLLEKRVLRFKSRFPS